MSRFTSAEEARGSAEVVHLTDVPFFPNSTDQCGPSALTSVLSYWHKDVTPESVNAEVYTPKIRGTLPMDMGPALKKHGLTGEVISGSFEDLKKEIREGRPVIAYLDFGTRKHPIGHFLVVTGFDDKRKGLYVHSGLSKDKFASYRRFDRGWKDADRWMMTVAPASGAPVTEAPLIHHAPDLTSRMSAEEHFELGSAYEQKNLLKDAEAQYSEALVVDRKFEPALMALGNLSFARNDYKRAERFYRKVLKRNPAHGGANNNLAMVYLSTGKNLKKAEQMARIAMDTDYRPYAQDTLNQIQAKTKS